MKSIKVGLVDDHRLIRAGISMLLSRNEDFKVILEACDGQDLIEKINKKDLPDIILMDISMPRMDGISATKWMRQNYPGVKILVFSMFEDAEKVLTMVRLGVKGYLLKDSEPEELFNAIYRIHQNEIYYPEFVTKHLVDNINIDYTLTKLNTKEVEFLKWTSTELTYKEIAEKMEISSRAVDAYRDQLFDKLGIKSRIGLVLYAIKNRLIEV